MSDKTPAALSALSDVPLIEDPAVQDCGHGYSPHEFCPVCDLDSEWGDE